jgi:hypothetical protein
MISSNGFDTTSIAVSSIKTGIDEIVTGVQEKINIVFCDLIEPMELYAKHYIQSSSDLLAEGKS